MERSIWFNPTLSLDYFETFSKDTLAHFIGIKFTEIGNNFLKATMPVDARTKQPFGLLHGGASVVLAETVGSVASNLVVDSAKIYMCRA